ncbi:MAG: hypothetical protein AB1405_17235 [Bdellovibrionota bacterium]
MKRFGFVSLVFSLWFLGGCGGDGDCAPVDLSPFLNGPSAAGQTSEWQCASGAGPFAFAVFEDGTGLSTVIGAFDWTDDGCGRVDVDGAVHQEIYDIEASVLFGAGTFRIRFDDGSTDEAVCAAVIVP